MEPFCCTTGCDARCRSRPLILVALAMLACGGADNTDTNKQRGFHPVDGEPHAWPDGDIRLEKDGDSLLLKIALLKNPEVYQCQRLTLDACTVTTCTGALGADPQHENDGALKFSWATATLDVSTSGDIGGYVLDSTVQWTPGEPILTVGSFVVGPPIQEELVAPPLLVLSRPAFEPSFNGPPDAAGVLLDTSQDLTIDWAPSPVDTLNAILTCVDQTARHLTEVKCTAPASAGTLVVSADALRYLPTSECHAGSRVDILAGDFRELVTSSWTYELAVVRAAQTPGGVDATTALTPR